MSEAIHVLDGYYLSISFIITAVYQLGFFAFASSFKFDKLTGKAAYHAAFHLSSQTALSGHLD